MLITLSGTMVISCLVNIVQGGGGEVLPRFGMLENSPKTVKCVITFETDCRLTGKAPLRAYAEQQVKLEPTKYDRPVGLKEKA